MRRPPRFLLLLGLLGACRPLTSGPHDAGVDESDAGTFEPHVPGRPTVLAVTPGFEAATVEFAGPAEATPPITHYVVTAWRLEALEASTTVGPTATTAVVEGLAQGTDYTFTVVAVNNEGPSPASESFGPVLVESLPGVVREAYAIGRASSVWASWLPGESGGVPDGYELEVEDADGNLVQQQHVTTLSALLEGLTDGTSYRVGIGATNSAGTGPLVWTRFVAPGTDLLPPTNVVAQLWNHAFAVLTWDPPSRSGSEPLIIYIPKVWPEGGVPYEYFDAPPRAKSWTVYGLLPGVTYRFSMIARTASARAESGLSNAMTTTALPGAPTNVTAHGVDGGVQVDWSPPSTGGPVTGYHIQSISDYLSVDVPADPPRAVVQLPDGLNLPIRVQSKGPVGDSALSAPSCVVSSGPAPAHFSVAEPVNSRLVPTAWGEVTAGDLDQDGDPDLVVTRHTGNGTAILLQQSGVFVLQEPLVTPSSYGSSNPQVVDLDGDGDLDIVAADELESTVSVFLNPGDGVFTTSVPVTVGYHIELLHLRDVTGDSRPDLIVQSSDSYAQVPVLRWAAGVGDGTFGPLAPLALTGLTRATGLQVEDFDGDGHLDLGVTYEVGQAALYAGAGDGTFTLRGAPEPIAGTFPRVTTGDFNGDGRPELLVATTSAFVTLGLETDQTLFSGTALSTDTFALAVAPLSISADAQQDFVASNWRGLDFYESDGAGGFTLALRSAFAGVSFGGLKAVDIDTDGAMDLVMADQHRIRVFRRAGYEPGCFP